MALRFGAHGGLMCPLEKGVRGIETGHQMPGRSWRAVKASGDGKPVGPDRPLGKGDGEINRNPRGFNKSSSDDRPGICDGKYVEDAKAARSVRVWDRVPIKQQDALRKRKMRFSFSLSFHYICKLAQKWAHTVWSLMMTIRTKNRERMKLNITALTVKSLAAALVALTLTVAASGQPRAAKAEGRMSAQKVESISNCILIDAVQRYEDGDYAGAKTILTAILSKEPGNDAAWYYRAMCNVRLKDGAASEHDFKEAVRIDSTNYWYRYMLAGLYGMTGRKDLTISMYESLLKDFPKRSELYYGLANLYLDQHQDDKALETINDIETQFGKSDATVMTKVNILRGQDKPEEVYKTLHDYYNEEYSSPQIATMLGDYEISMYNDSSAIAYYDEALSIDKNYSPALLGKAEAYRMTRKYPEYFVCLNTLMGDREASPEGKANYIQAVLKQSDPRFVKSFQNQFDSTLTIAVNTHPKDTSILQAAGLYYLATERQSRSAEIFKSVAKDNPDNLEATAYYIQVLIYMKDWQKVVDESDSALVRFPDEIGFLEMANAGEYNLKNYDKVIRNCRTMIDKAPGDSATTVAALSTMGDMYHQLGDMKSAFKAYDMVLKIAPDYIPVLNNYAYYLSVEKKKLKKAYAMSKKTVEAEPDNATYLDTFGWILYLQGKALEAKPFFKHAMLYGGKESATILNHYATVLEALGESDLAKVYRQQAKNKEAQGLE